MSVCYFLTDC